MSKKLFDDSDDNLDNDSFHIKTNESYAKTYNSLRKKELLQKYKDRGLDASETDSDESDSSEEDEVLDPSFDKDFLKALASLKSKDPAIYDEKTKFFKSTNSDEESAEEGGENVKRKEKKLKPVTLKDYERKIILEKEGKFVDDSDEEIKEQTAARSLSPTIVEEEQSIKAKFKEVLNTDDDSGGEEFGGIFKKREKSKAEKEKEEEDYLQWMAGKRENIDETVREKLEPLKNYWGNDKLPSSEKFLRDYVLNKGYSDATNYAEIPTYEEIVGDQAPLSEDEQELEKQAEFEQKYNFRYEEPDQEFIKRYPRTIESSLRLTDEKRKKKRQEIKERKLQEKQLKMKEVEMVKDIKRKEIQEKIEKLKMVTGNDELGFKDDDLEEDFDPEAHDRRMQELFDDEYYQVDEGEDKPECPSDIEELKVEDWDNYDPQKDEEQYDVDDNYPHCEDEDFNMDCDYDPIKAKEELQKELVENTRKRRGRKSRRDRFREIINSEKPVFDPEDEKTYGEYIDEYYKLDCEDIIGDTPCRFKYVETTPNDFGLSIEEILLAKNKELNRWASLKKAIQIRPDNVEKREQKLYKLKSKNEELKRKILKSLYGEGSDDDNEELEEDVSIKNSSLIIDSAEKNSVQGESKKAKKRRKRKMLNTEESIQNTLDEKVQLQATHKRLKEETTVVNDIHEGAIEVEVKGDDTKVVLEKKNKNEIQTLHETENATTNNNKKQALGKNAQASIYGKKLSNKHLSENTKDVGSKKSVAENGNSKTKSTDSKTVIKNNPFAKVSSSCNKSLTESTVSLPPLRKNIPKSKFKSELKNKNGYKRKYKTGTKGDNKDISDGRLKAYGINPRKFHKKQKYGNAK